MRTRNFNVGGVNVQQNYRPRRKYKLDQRHLANFRAPIAEKSRPFATKFEVGDDPLEREERLKSIMPTSKMQLTQMGAIIDNLYAKAKSAAEKNALEMWRMQLKKAAAKDEVNFQFLRNFYFWLLGRGSDEDTKNTMWGRANVAVHCKEVADYIDQFAKKRLEYALKIALMADRVPDTINGFYLYYKYVVNQRLKRVTKGNSSWWDLQQSDFLEDFDLLTKEFDKDVAGAGELMRPTRDRPANKPGFGSVQNTTISDGGPTDPYPYTAADRKKYALNSAESRRLGAEQIASDIGGPPPGGPYSRPRRGGGDDDDGPPENDDRPPPPVPGERGVQAPAPVIDTSALEAMFGSFATQMQSTMEQFAQADNVQRQTMTNFMQQQNLASERLAAELRNIRADRNFQDIQQNPAATQLEAIEAQRRAEEEEQRFQRLLKENEKQSAQMGEVASVMKQAMDLAKQQHAQMQAQVRDQTNLLSERARVASENQANLTRDRQELLAMFRDMMETTRMQSLSFNDAVKRIESAQNNDQTFAAISGAVTQALNMGTSKLSEIVNQYQQLSQGDAESRRQAMAEFANLLRSHDENFIQRLTQDQQQSAQGFQMLAQQMQEANRAAAEVEAAHRAQEAEASRLRQEHINALGVQLAGNRDLVQLLGNTVKVEQEQSAAERAEIRRAFNLMPHLVSEQIREQYEERQAVKQLKQMEEEDDILIEEMPEPPVEPFDDKGKEEEDASLMELEYPYNPNQPVPPPPEAKPMPKEPIPKREMPEPEPMPQPEPLKRNRAERFEDIFQPENVEEILEREMEQEQNELPGESLVERLDGLFQRFQQNDGLSADAQAQLATEYHDILVQMAEERGVRKTTIPRRIVNQIEKPTSKWMRELFKFKRSLEKQGPKVRDAATMTQARREKAARRTETKRQAAIREKREAAKPKNTKN